MAPSSSPNFSYLGYFDARLVAAASRAEHVLALDPVGALQHLRLFGELLAKAAAARMRVEGHEDDSQVERLRALGRRGVNQRALDLFHQLRVTGNRAAHDGEGDQASALDHLKMARELALWFQRSFGNNRKFDPGPFVPPPDFHADSEQLRQQVEELRAASEAAEAQREKALREAAAQAERVQDAEARARQAEEERELYAALAEEEEAKRVNNRQALEAAQRRIAELERRHAEQMAALQARVAPPTPQEAEQVVERTNEAAAQINLDEAATRRLIDEQLRAAGWEADSEALRHAAGARPQKGKNLAIAEWPTKSGPADYVLFTGTRALGVVEAKKRRRDVSAALAQSKRYSEGFAPKDGAEEAGGPWGKYRVPFLFATNGRRYFKQLETKSGIWFLDARRPQNLSTALPDWYTPEVDGQIHPLERTILPSAELVNDCIRSLADEVRANVNAVELFDMSADIANRHSACVHGDDLVVEAVEAAVMLRNQLGLERPLSVARDLDSDLALGSADGFLGLPVAAIFLPLRRLLATLVAEVVVELAVHGPAHQRGGQLFHQAVWARDILGAAGAVDELVEQLRRKMAFRFLVRVLVIHDGPSCFKKHPSRPTTKFLTVPGAGKAVGIADAQSAIAQ